MARVASTSCGRPLKMKFSLNVPFGPPSALAPLSLSASDQRAVELAAAGEEVEQAAEVVIGVRQEAGIDLHHAGVCAPLLGRKRRPVLHPRRPSRQRRSRRDDSGRDLPRQRSLAPHVPPLVEPPAIALDPLAGRLVRRVARAQRQIEEERLVGVRRADVDDALDGVVHQVLGQMVAVGRREPERRVVGHQIGRELVGLAAEKAVVALEALAEGPAIARGGGVLLVGRVPGATSRLRTSPIPPGAAPRR